MRLHEFFGPAFISNSSTKTHKKVGLKFVDGAARAAHAHGRYIF
jgi:hypothetical protein